MRQQIDALASGEHPNADQIGVRLEAAVQEGKLEDVARREKVWQLLDTHRYAVGMVNHASNPRILDIVANSLGQMTSNCSIPRH